MAEKREYRSAARSRRMIREAFLELLKEKDFSKITVTDIVKRADLNRSTFYAHYPDVNGVVEEIEQEIIRKSLENFHQQKGKAILKDPLPYLMDISDMLEEHIQFYAHIGHTQDIHKHLDEFRRLMAEDILKHPSMPQEIRDSPEAIIHLHFFLGGLFNTYQQWAQGNLDCSLDEISRQIAAITQRSYADVLDAGWMK